MKYVRTEELNGYTFYRIKWQTKQPFCHKRNDQSRIDKNQHFFIAVSKFQVL